MKLTELEGKGGGKGTEFGDKQTKKTLVKNEVF